MRFAIWFQDAVLPGAAALGVFAALSLWAASSPERPSAITAGGVSTETATPGPVPSPEPFSNPITFPPVLTSPDISMNIEEACIQVLPGPCTNMWTYNGSFPGPTIRRPTGETTKVSFTNKLPSSAGEMTVHNHGNHSTSENDGQPHDHLIPAGESLTYTYEELEAGSPERGATQWYHDHRMDVTGRNVWNGLAGMYILDDAADPQTLPSGDYDRPLILMDRAFDASNQIPYVFSSNGVTGSSILVNGVYQPYLNVGDRKYRFRILDGSNARVYELALGNGDAFTQVGTESGLLPAPVSRTQMLISPSERLDVVVDFAGKLGQTFFLRDLRSGLDVLQFRVNQDVNDDSTVPATLRPLPDLGDPTVTRTFTFSRLFGSWVINGRPFDPNRVDVQPVLGATEKWVFQSSTTDGGALHTVHIHGIDQQCISRGGNSCPPYEAMKEAWLLTPGEPLEVKLRFTDHTGRFVFHCHFLEHEDAGMMAQYEVVDSTPTPTATASPSPTPTGTPTPTPTPTGGPTMKGDADCNGEVNTADALIALRESADLPNAPSAECVAQADVDCSGYINAVDALLILRYSAGLPVAYPPGCTPIGK